VIVLIPGLFLFHSAHWPFAPACSPAPSLSLLPDGAQTSGDSGLWSIICRRDRRMHISGGFPQVPGALAGTVEEAQRRGGSHMSSPGQPVERVNLRERWNRACRWTYQRLTRQPIGSVLRERGRTSSGLATAMSRQAFLFPHVADAVRLLLSRRTPIHPGFNDNLSIADRCNLWPGLNFETVRWT